MGGSSANPVTAQLQSVPIASSPGRSGFGPQLSLSHDPVPAMTLQVGMESFASVNHTQDRQSLQVRRRQPIRCFILSGVEDLVPVLTQDAAGKWVREVVQPRTVNQTVYEIQRYRPRIEGLFARIERWTSLTKPENTFWRSTSKDNITTWYGKTDESRIVDPADPTKIFSWLICESYDDKGNVIAYQYKSENSENLDDSQAHERNRSLEGADHVPDGRRDCSHYPRRAVPRPA